LFNFNPKGAIGAAGILFLAYPALPFLLYIFLFEPYFPPVVPFLLSGLFKGLVGSDI